jgi:CheY-like chemotaxis protein
MNQPSVLIVDDEPDNFDAIEALLGDCGYDLDCAVDGRHAIDSLDIFQPDLLLLDVMMPNVDGLEVCQWMNDSPRWKFMPINGDLGDLDSIERQISQRDGIPPSTSGTSAADGTKLNPIAWQLLFLKISTLGNN